MDALLVQYIILVALVILALYCSFRFVKNKLQPSKKSNAKNEGSCGTNCGCS